MPPAPADEDMPVSMSSTSLLPGQMPAVGAAAIVAVKSGGDDISAGFSGWSSASGKSSLDSDHECLGAAGRRAGSAC